MTEAQFIASVKEWGPWAAMGLMLVYIVANKLGPQWLAAWFEERKQARAAAEAERLARIEEEKSGRQTTNMLYERLAAQNGEMIKFIASATEAIHGMSRTLDGNTQQMYRLTQSVERGPRCPLPDCPFIKNPEALPVAGKQGA